MTAGANNSAALGRPLVALLLVACVSSCKKGDTEEATQRDQRAATKAQQMQELAAICETTPRRIEPCERACTLGHSNSCARLAQLLESSGGNLTRAMALLEEACLGGSGIGCEEAGRFARGGIAQEASETVAKEHDAAARRYHRVHCEQGFAPSCLGLARMYADGRGGPPAPELTDRFKTRACELGLQQACAPERAAADASAPAPSR